MTYDRFLLFNKTSLASPEPVHLNNSIAFRNSLRGTYRNAANIR